MTKFGLVFIVILLGSAVMATLQPSRRSTHALDAGVVANERLTAILGALLAVLVAAIAITTLYMPGFLAAHYLVGLLLVPPLLLKLGTTGWRFGRYYTRNAAYRLAGPPSALLRWLVAPALVASSVTVFATELWLFGLRLGGWWTTAHTLSAVVFMLAIGVLERVQLGSVDAAWRNFGGPNWVTSPIRRRVTPSEIARCGRDGRGRKCMEGS